MTRFFVSRVLWILLLIPLITTCTKPDEPIETTYTLWALGTNYTDFGTLFYTQNDGLNWERLTSTAFGFQVPLLDISTVDYQNGWIAGGIQNGTGSIRHTMDGGITWNMQGSATEIPVASLHAVKAIDLLSVWVAGDSSTILHSADQGMSWNRIIVPGIPSVSYRAIAHSGTQFIWLAGYEDQPASPDSAAVLLHTTDRGATWVRHFLPPGSPQWISSAFAVNDTVIWLVGNHSIMKSANGGYTWNTLVTNPAYVFEAIVAIDPLDIWVVGSNDAVFHTTTGGQLWNQVTTQLTGFDFCDVTAIGSNRIWIVGNKNGKGYILYSRNSGTTWFVEDPGWNVELTRISASYGVK